jgi:hypothetical protein
LGSYWETLGWRSIRSWKPYGWSTSLIFFDCRVKMGQSFQEFPRINCRALAIWISYNFSQCSVFFWLPHLAVPASETDQGSIRPPIRSCTACCWQVNLVLKLSCWCCCHCCPCGSDAMFAYVRDKSWGVHPASI